MSMGFALIDLIKKFRFLITSQVTWCNVPLWNELAIDLYNQFHNTFIPSKADGLTLAEIAVVFEMMSVNREKLVVRLAGIAVMLGNGEKLMLVLAGIAVVLKVSENWEELMPVLAGMAVVQTLENSEKLMLVLAGLMLGLAVVLENWEELMLQMRLAGILVGDEMVGNWEKLVLAVVALLLKNWEDLKLV